MRLRNLRMLALVSFVLFGMGTQPVKAIAVDNSQAPADAFCSGDCGVGSVFGFSRTVPGLSRHADTVFSDAWFLTLSEPGRVVGVLFANNTIDNFRLFDLNLGLERGGVRLDPADGFSVPDPPPSNTILQTVVAFSYLPAGDYRLDVSGRILDCDLSGQYEFQGGIYAMPLPATGWLFIAALLALLGWSRAGHATRRG